jgi:hypothetical protein
MDVMEIVLVLVEDNKLMFVPKHEEAWLNEFFKVLVRFDWRKWIEAVKAEIQGWLDNDAVEIVRFKDGPASPKVIPLGELYTIKHDGRYKGRQYLMGNLLRPGLVFDSIGGNLQTKEQFDIYAYLPTHEGYSILEYEDARNIFCF